MRTVFFEKTKSFSVNKVGRAAMRDGVSRVRMPKSDDKYKTGTYITTAISRLHFQIHAVDLCARI